MTKAPHTAVPRLYTMDEAAVEMRVSRRWLQDFIQQYPYYRLAGRKKLFTPEHIARLIEAMPCPGNSSRRAPVRRAGITSAARTSASDLTTALELARRKRRGASSPLGESRPSVVNFPSTTK